MTELKRLTAYEVFQIARTSLMSCIGQCHTYGNWSPEFIKSEINTVYDRLIKLLRDKYEYAKVNELSSEELLDLGFRHWDGAGLLLAPIWMLPFLKLDKDQIFTDINGGTFTFGVDPTNDVDNRGGSLAWGVVR